MRSKRIEHNADSFFAGLVGGYLVFGNETPVNNQVVCFVSHANRIRSRTCVLTHVTSRHVTHARTLDCVVSVVARDCRSGDARQGAWHCSVAAQGQVIPVDGRSRLVNRFIVEEYMLFVFAVVNVFFLVLLGE